MSIIYKAQRIGKNGKVFTCYKFKTLREEPGPSSSGDDDPRITKIGRILRKTKIDELPQIINIFKGEMTLIGWRPEDPKYLNTIHPEVLATKPGIIGWATLSDMDEGGILRGSLDPDKDYEEKILPKKRELEIWYVRNKSLKLDILIFVKTIRALLGK